MIKKVVLLLAIAAVVPVLAAGPVRSFAIGGVSVPQDQVIDARAVPGLDGAVSILVSLEPGAIATVSKQSVKSAGKPLQVMLDGRPISELKVLPARQEPIELPVRLSLADAEGVAMHISGKPPLPDSLEDGE